MVLMALGLEQNDAVSMLRPESPFLEPEFFETAASTQVVDSALISHVKGNTTGCISNHHEVANYGCGGRLYFP